MRKFIDSCKEYIQFVLVDWWSKMSGALAIPFGLVALFTQGHPKTYFTLLAFLALLITSYGLVKRILGLKEKLRPKLEITCAPDIPGCIVANVMGSNCTNLFFRIVVKSAGHSTVKNCQGRLVCIEKDSKVRWTGDTAVLTFAPGENDDAEAKTIYDNTPVHLDVLWLYYGPAQNFLGIFPGTKHRQWRFFPKLETIFDTHGDYILTMQIVGDEIPTTTAYLEFKWTGNQLSQLRLLQIKS